MLKKKEAPQAKTAAKPVKAAKKQAKPSLFKRLAKFIRDVIAELKKVTWPTRKDFVTYSGMVLAFIVLMGLITFGIDSVITALTSLLMG